MVVEKIFRQKRHETLDNPKERPCYNTGVDKLAHLYHLSCPLLIVWQSERRITDSFSCVNGPFSKTIATIDSKLFSGDLFHKKMFYRKNEKRFSHATPPQAGTKLFSTETRGACPTLSGRPVPMQSGQVAQPRFSRLVAIIVSTAGESFWPEMNVKS
ncbi:MAG: hypothetical protein TUN42_08935 [Dehalogenimonas sp.]